MKTTTRPRTDTYRSRFGLAHHPLPRDASGKAFFDQTAGYQQLEMAFQELLDEPGLGVLTAEPGVGKTAAIRNLCAALPSPDFKLVYLCDTDVSAFDFYRTLALELGLRPSHRKAELRRELKRTLAHFVEEQHTLPVIVVDEAHLLPDSYLGDLTGFLNFDFDRKTLFALWLVGLPKLRGRLQLQHHASLASRLSARVHLESLHRDDFAALIAHGLKVAGAKDKLLTDTAQELLWSATRGNPRAAGKLLRRSLQQAHRRGQSLVDDHALAAAIEELTPSNEGRP